MGGTSGGLLETPPLRLPAFFPPSRHDHKRRDTGLHFARSMQRAFIDTSCVLCRAYLRQFSPALVSRRKAVILDDCFHYFDFETMPPFDLSALNPAQRDAVLASDAPILILAGSGSRQRRLLPSRI